MVRMFSLVRWLPSSLTDASSSVFLLLIKPGDHIKQTITLTEMTDFSGLNIVGNIWDLVSAQLKMGVSVKHSNCVIYSQLWHWDHTVTWSSMTPRVPGTRLISTLPHTHTHACTHSSEKSKWRMCWCEDSGRLNFLTRIIKMMEAALKADPSHHISVSSPRFWSIGRPLQWWSKRWSKFGFSWTEIIRTNVVKTIKDGHGRFILNRWFLVLPGVIYILCLREELWSLGDL